MIRIADGSKLQTGGGLGEMDNVISFSDQHVAVPDHKKAG